MGEGSVGVTPAARTGDSDRSVSRRAQPGDGSRRIFTTSMTPRDYDSGLGGWPGDPDDPAAGDDDRPPSTRLFAVLEVGDPLDRMHAFSRLVRRLDAAGLAEALTAFEQLPDGMDRAQEFNMLLFRWAQLDGTAAAEYAMSLEEGWLGRSALSNALSGWAGRDAEAAITWARANHEGEDNPLLVGVIAGLVDIDGERATEVLATLPYGRQRGRAVDMMLDAKMREGPDAAIAWADRFEEEVLRKGATVRVARRLGNLAPAEYADWALSVAGEDTQREVVGAFAQSWARSDPQGAAAWASGAPGEAVSSQARAGVLRSWIRVDDAAALAWVQEVGTVSEMDHVIRRYVGHHNRSNPETALAWAQQLSNADDRDRWVGQLEQRIERDKTR